MVILNVAYKCRAIDFIAWFAVAAHLGSRFNACICLICFALQRKLNILHSIKPFVLSESSAGEYTANFTVGSCSLYPCQK